MVLLKARNPSILDLERTEVRVAPSAGATSLDVDWTENFSANDYIVIGELGTETCEMVQVTAVTDKDTLAVTALVHAHIVDEPVHKTLFNQMRFYSDADSYATALTTKNIDWANPNHSTHYEDSAGTSSTKYKFSFYNSQTTTESDKSPEFEIPTYYCSLKDIEDFVATIINQDSEITPSQVISMIRASTREADILTGSSFKTNTISTSNYEYHDGKKDSDNFYYTKNRPIISVTTLQTTSSSESVGPTNASWTSLTENDDFTVDKETGMITIVDSTVIPAEGDNRLRVAYTWGHASVPDDIRYLTTLLVTKQLHKSGVSKSLLQGREGRFQDLEFLQNEIDNIVSRYTFKTSINT